MRKNICLVLLFLLLLMFLVSMITGSGRTSAMPGYTTPVFPEEWQQTIVQGVNQETLKLSVDGKTVDAEREEPFLTNDSRLMLPLSWIHKAFTVMTAEDGKGKVTVLYGNHTLEIINDDDKILLDGKERPAAGNARILNGTMYLASDLIAEAFSVRISWDTDRTAVLFTTDPEESRLPEKFILSDYGKLPAVQNQLDLGSCSAFAALSALESVRLPLDSDVFSRDHLLAFEGFPEEDEDVGGSPTEALAYLLSGEGPVDGSKDPYGDGETVTGEKALCRVEGAYQMTSPDTETLKEACFRYGGVEATMYLKMADKEVVDRATEAYNEDAAAYCCLDKEEVNHDVVIVGWDDAFPRTLFPCGDKLSRDGAFLCLNSWGKEFGKDGLFYVSYEDASFAPYAMAYTVVEDADPKARVYQKDLHGPEAQAGYGNEDAWFANVYTAESGENLTGAGFYTLGMQSEYELYIVPNFENVDSFSTRKLVKSGTLDYSGYHRIWLKEEIRLEKGERFAVLVHLKTGGANFPVAVAAPMDGQEDQEDVYGYLGSNGADFKSTRDQGSCSICLKAYTEKR